MYTSTKYPPFQFLNSTNRNKKNCSTYTKKIHNQSRPATQPYNPTPSPSQVANRKIYQKTVTAVADSNARETKSILSIQTDRQRFDPSVMLGGDCADWKSIPVAPPKSIINRQGGLKSPDPMLTTLGFEPEDSVEHHGIDLDGHHAEAHERHNSLMAHIDHLRTIDGKFARKSPRPIKTHAEAVQIKETAAKAPLDKRILNLEHAVESCFNEEIKMKSVNHDFTEHCKWLHRRAVNHTMKSFISAMATLNQNGPDHDDNARMIDMLKHQSEFGELYLIAIVVRDCPDICHRMNIKTNTTIPARCTRILEIAHEVHRILVSAPGSSKVLKLRDIGRVFAKELIDLKQVFNEWDKKQVMRFSRLTRSISITGILPFTQAPTPAQIEAARVHSETLHEHERNEIISTYHHKLSRRGGNHRTTNQSSEEDEEDALLDDGSSVSSSGSSSGSESIGSAESR